MKAIRDRYTNAEIEQIDKVIQEDQDKRLAILKKCLLKRQIPQSQYLKFGECMAYFMNTYIMDHFFSKEEADTLLMIWQNFESK